MGSDAKVVKLYLIRHGETVDNVKSLYGGVRDSQLTVHGVQQAQRLSDWLDSNRPALTHVFSSDLSRAVKTAESICQAQPEVSRPQHRQLPVLQEQNFGYLEGKSWVSRKDDKSTLAKSKLEPVESKESMAARADEFLTEHLDPILGEKHKQESTTSIAVVSHGMMLASIWRRMLKRQPAGSVELDAALPTGMEHLASAGWSNTGFLELDLTVSASATTLKVKTINCRAHLDGLKRARGGIGSSAFDQHQRPIDSFFKKPRKK